MTLPRMGYGAMQQLAGERRQLGRDARSGGCGAAVAVLCQALLFRRSAR